MTERRKANNTKAVCTDVCCSVSLVQGSTCSQFPQSRPEKKTTASRYRTITMGNGPQQVAAAATRIEVGPPEKHGK